MYRLFEKLLGKFRRHSVHEDTTVVEKKGVTDEDRLFEVLQPHILTLFMYGSTVYGTTTKKSDEDLVAIVDDTVDLSSYTNGIWEYHKGNTDYQFVNESRMIEMIHEHHIIALEMLSLPDKYVLKGDMRKYNSYFKLDKWKLRQVISSISSNAFSKAHKKMTVEKDYDMYKAQKSLFHSIRVMLFGIQIAKYGKIEDYTEANRYWIIISSMKDSPWQTYKETFKPIINAIRSEFVVLCPKPEEYIQEKYGLNNNL